MFVCFVCVCVCFIWIIFSLSLIGFLCVRVCTNQPTTKKKKNILVFHVFFLQNVSCIVPSTPIFSFVRGFHCYVDPIYSSILFINYCRIIIIIISVSSLSRVCHFHLPRHFSQLDVTCQNHVVRFCFGFKFLFHFFLKLCVVVFLVLCFDVVSTWM